MKRNRETQKDLKLKALSSMFNNRIQSRRLFVTSHRKNLTCNLGASIFNITKILVPRFRDYDMHEFLTIKRINPEFD
jgi:hypothetical protein